MPDKRILIFDLDGTLIDTMTQLTDLFCEMLQREHGVADAVSRPIYVELAGKGPRPQFEAVLATIGHQDQELLDDITDPEAVEAAVEAIERAAGPVDGLVNNAGWDSAANFLDTEIVLWRKLIDVNLIGPLNVTKSVLTRMRERRTGRIVSIASDAGRVGSSGESVYAACKGGIIAFTKSVAREMARDGITLNVVSPGPSDTPLFANFDPSGKLAKALERAIPMGRIGQPADYPGIVAFLLSDDAAFITGQTISVSGGLTMHG
jgi:2-hydroxycyclohexanecarboxyl-CoA dehydrogenase